MQIWIDGRSPFAFETIYGVTLTERILRQLYEFGVRKDVTVILKPSTQLERFIREDFRPRYQIEVHTVYSEAPLLEVVDRENSAGGSLMLLEGDGIYDERIFKRLLTSTSSLYIHAGNDEEAPIAAMIQSDDRKHLGTDTLDARELFAPGDGERLVG